MDQAQEGMFQDVSLSLLCALVLRTPCLNDSLMPTLMLKKRSECMAENPNVVSAGSLGWRGVARAFFKRLCAPLPL